jgi:hypothetical protein
MLGRYRIRTVDEAVGALREIVQEIALLGLWRARLFEHAALYGGTALRVLHGLDRFSEDLDFTLLEPRPDFDLGRFTGALAEEVRAFGFEVEVTLRQRAVPSPIQSAFLKADTRHQLLVIDAPPEMIGGVPRGQKLRVKVEVDTDPPGGFRTTTRYLLHPIPFSVRACELPDLFAGKMHAVLCRRWKNRVKGRDWYDFVWFAANHPELRLPHLEQRMRQTGDWTESRPLPAGVFRGLLDARIDSLDVEQARGEVLPFLKQPDAVVVWSRDFFRDVARRIVCVADSR